MVAKDAKQRDTRRTMEMTNPEELPESITEVDTGFSVVVGFGSRTEATVVVPFVPWFMITVGKVVVEVTFRSKQVWANILTWKH
jgi:ssDNA-binding replication factor A large subunit